MRLKHWLYATVILAVGTLGQGDSTCSADKPCYQGCCNGQTGNCGFSPDFCGDDVCISNCDAKAECGQYAAAGDELCPLNVCCSQFGYCGTTADFCGDGCQSGCEKVNEPSCGGSSSAQRYIGYYESWNVQHACDTIKPSDIDANVWTHLNYAFALIGSDGTLTTLNDYDTEFYTEFNALKKINPALKTFLSVGGWDAGGEVFSNMVAHTFSRRAFINSAISTMEQYGFDGIDIDWEYPAADDRGGVEADTANFVEFLKELKAAAGGTYGVTATIPSSYWYMRGFDIVGMAQYLDWFNFMSYDIHGTWDGDSPYTQRVVNPHTNLTDIATGLDLLWRNNIDPGQVCLGLGFYGRSFTLSDPSCNTPGCPFAGSGGGSGGGKPGPCTGVSGTLSDYEMARILASDSPDRVYNAEAGVNWMTWDSNQWVSFDDGHTLNQKAQFANGKCMGGSFAWAIDLGGPGSLANPNALGPGDLGLTGAGDNGTESGGSGDPNDGHAPSGEVYIDPIIYQEPDPTIACYPPCTFILPPYTFSSASTISFPPWTTSLEVGWDTTSLSTLPGGSVSTSTGYTTITQTTVIYIPAVTTSMVDVWNFIWGGDGDQATATSTSNISPLPPPATGGGDTTSDSNTPPPMTTTTYSITSSVLPPPVTITDDPNPLNQTGVSHTRRATRTITPPPYPHTTSSTSNTPPIFPPIYVTRGPPDPVCKTGCGHKCHIFCDGLCGLDCAGLDGENNDGFDDPTDPDDDGPDAGPLPEPDPSDPTDPCEPDVDTDFGLCANGNFPLWNPSIMSVSCDTPNEDIDDSDMSSCQANIDDPTEDSQDDADDSSNCCELPSKFKRSLDWLFYRTLGKRAKRQCGAGRNPDFPNNPPPGPDPFHSVFTCSFQSWPNVCANALSAISERGKPNILTYAGPNGDLHVTTPWYDNRYGIGYGNGNSGSQARDGWALKNCQVEEYPFGSGNPNRNPNGKVWNEQSVLRLIPGGENSKHGNALSNFYKDAGNGNRKQATGLIYKVDFDGAPAGRSDADYGLGPNQDNNVCGQPHGVEFLLVNNANTNAGERRWDPWWDSRLQTKTYSIDQQGNALTTQLPSQFCQYPSPGRMVYLDPPGAWSDRNGNVQYAIPRDRILNNDQWRTCNNYAGYAGPMLKRRGRRHLDTKTQPLNVSTSSLPGYVQLSRRGVVSDFDFLDVDSAPLRSGGGLTRRQAASGSFLDASAYEYLGCPAYDGDDPCAYADNCGPASVPRPDGGDSGAGGNSPSTTTLPPLTSTVTIHPMADPTTVPAVTITSFVPPPPATSTKVVVVHSSNCRVCTDDGDQPHCTYVDNCQPTPTTPFTPIGPGPTMTPDPLQPSSDTKNCTANLNYDIQGFVGGGEADSTNCFAYVYNPAGAVVNNFDMSPDGGGGNWKGTFILDTTNDEYTIRGNYDGFSNWNSCSLTRSDGVLHQDIDGTPSGHDLNFSPIGAGQNAECGIVFACNHYNG